MLPTSLRGARTHNLKGVDLDLSPGQVVVLSGVSGAGKSSLALDTLYAEGQRRFVESFSPYARQFLERLERPPVDRLDPVPAAVAVDRRAPVKSSRSTLASMADLEPYLSALFFRESLPNCPTHGVPATHSDPQTAAERALQTAPGQRVIVSYPTRVDTVEQYLELRDRLSKDGYRRLWLNGRILDLDEARPSAFATEPAHVVVDRLALKKADTARLATAIETAWQRGAGRATLHRTDAAQALDLRQGLSCPVCAKPLRAATSALFSYDSPVGACPACRGFGRTIGIDLNKVIPDPSKSLSGGAIRPWTGKSTSWERGQLKRYCQRLRIPMDRPFASLSHEQQQAILCGDGGWEGKHFPGIYGWFEWLETRTYKMHVRVFLARYRAYNVCDVCHGRRLNPDALSYRIGERTIADFRELEIRDCVKALEAVTPRTGQGELARNELLVRLRYLERVGLGYLNLARQARTLSAGEAQRVTLTAALGTSLNNALFVLDEPTVGLHPSDIAPLTELVRQLAARNNTVLITEHDPAVLLAADRIVELGPRAGAEGGRITFDGTPKAALESKGATQRALTAAPATQRKRRAAKGYVHLRGVRAHNIDNLDVSIPLGVVCAITGPSGSGKSTLMVDVLYRALSRRLGDFSVDPPLEFDELTLDQKLRSVTLVDQAPLGRTSRGNAATYTKAWDPIRKMLAAEPLSEELSLTASHFSFNVDKGRCATCNGEGYETVEMQFLADVRLVCPACRGRRFNDEVLRVQLRGRDVHELLELCVSDVIKAFFDVPAVLRALGPLEHLGLGYLRLGQPLSTLSGGEAQRLKLARALTANHRGSLLILDEPSAGLHADEVALVQQTLDSMVDAGASVVLIEHELALVAAADFVIDLGPGAGSEGGRLVAAGTPEELQQGSGKTGAALRSRALQSKKPRVQTRANDSARTAKPKRKPRAALQVTRAAEHNLKDVSAALPHGALTVVTGPSGSGKSSLVYDVVFAEGQRRFLETLTPYARQFLPTMPRPRVERVDGIPPSIALEQRTVRAGAKSTVATVTELAHYIRLLYAKLGIAHCPNHGLPIKTRAATDVFEQIRRLRGTRSLLSPAVVARKGTYLDVFNAAARAGISQAWVDGKLVDTDRPPKLARTREHTIDLIIADKVELRSLSLELFKRALAWGHGSLKLSGPGASEQLFSTQAACTRCGYSIGELDPRWFSFNTAQGSCPKCEGDGVVPASGRRKKKRRGRGKAPEALMQCPACQGSRLAALPRAVTLADTHLPELMGMSVERAARHVAGFDFAPQDQPIAQPIIVELTRRLGFLSAVGLDYLALDRSARTLSGGEMQRLRLAAQLGAGLTGALYVLDEPTIGLHPTDTGRLLDNLHRLVALGSTVVVVEHDLDTIRAADHLIDLGPTGGDRGGYVMAEGPPKKALKNPESPTAQALKGSGPNRTHIACGKGTEWLELKGARLHNLKSVHLKLPLARFNVVAGVSGSGKSSLVRSVLLPAVRESLGLVADPPGPFDSLSALGPLKRALAVDQSPIGRTPRSTPATFLGIWDLIRQLFARTPEAQIAGFNAARFSFNTKGGGRCTTCDGQGVITHEMSFLPDVIQSCPTCEGTRFEPRTLQILYRGYSISDVLQLSATQAAEVFANHPKVCAPLATLVDLGAGYIKLGQGSHTLSGGEAQRLKLAAELTAGARHEPTLYVLDEPTTGLHLSDVSKLMRVLDRLVQRGDTLVVIEHHPTVISGADWVVELGPGGGERGGRILAACPPNKLKKMDTPTASVVS